MEQSNSLIAMISVVDGEQLVVWNQSVLIVIPELLNGIHIFVQVEILFNVEGIDDGQIFGLVNGNSGLIWMLQ